MGQNIKYRYLVKMPDYKYKYISNIEIYQSTLPNIVKKFFIENRIRMDLELNKKYYHYKYSQSQIRDNIVNAINKRELDPDFIHLIKSDFSGLAELKVDKSKSTLNLLNIYILPEFRHKGIGKDLVNKAKYIARVNRLKYITYEVHPQNENSRNLAEKMGFKLDTSAS